MTVQELLHERAELNAKLKLIPYQGTTEIKTIAGKKYLYARNRVLGKLISTYIDKYSDELYTLLLKQSSEVKILNKRIRQINNELAKLNYFDTELSSRVILNIDFARINMKSLIYDQAILEGISTTFPQTETIIDNGEIFGVKPTDVQKILNLKHAWEFILDKDIITAPNDYYILCHIAKLVNEGFYEHGGKIRSVPVTIGGSTYVPPLPIEIDVKEQLQKITREQISPIDIAVNLCLYVMKTQIFNDGNKRAGVIFANHYLISKGYGLLVIPEKRVSEFKSLLVSYYEGTDTTAIKEFMKNTCLRQF